MYAGCLLCLCIFEYLIDVRNENEAVKPVAVQWGKLGLRTHWYFTVMWHGKGMHSTVWFKTDLPAISFKLNLKLKLT